MEQEDRSLKALRIGAGIGGGDSRAERPIDKMTIADLQKLLRDKQISFTSRKNRAYYIDRLLHGTTDNEDAIDDDIDDNEWTTCAHEVSLQYSAEIGYVDKIFYDNNAEYDRRGNLIDNPFSTGIIVDIVSRADNPGILFFKYYNHSKTDRQKPDDDDYDAWAYSTCNEMIDAKGDFTWPHLQSRSSSSSI